MKIKVFDAADLDREEWRQLQGVSREAFANTLDRTQDEIDAAVEWGDPTLFYASHVDPNFQVNGRYNADQSFSKPRVAVATETGAPIGFAFSAHNVSGANQRERMIKRLSVVKNYLWLREVAVAPEFQRQGIATDLGKALLRDAIPFQPPTAYIWPKEVGFLQGVLERAGFVATDEQGVRVFGEDSTLVTQVRLQAPSARSVLKKLRQNA